jgi:hypothetical protein
VNGKQLELVTAGYLRQAWEMCGWLFEGQYNIRPGYSCETKVVTVCQDTANSLEEVVRTDAIIDFSKAFNLVPHDLVLMKIAVNLYFRVVVW